MTRNKILIIFSDKCNNSTKYNKINIIPNIFGKALNENISSNKDDSILKRLIWKTKYYETQFDLYIDVYDVFDEWLNEFKEPACDELRSVLAGLIIVGNLNEDDIDRLNDIFKNIINVETFFIWCNTNESMSQETMEEQNTKFAIEGSSLEIVRLSENTETNEFNGKIGFERIQEVIDTYEWPELANSKNNQSIKASKEKDNLDSVINKLIEAKLHYKSINENDSEDADNFAKEIAEEISGYLDI